MRKFLSVMFVSLAVLGAPAVTAFAGPDCECAPCHCEQGQCECSKCSSK